MLCGRLIRGVGLGQRIGRGVRGSWREGQRWRRSSSTEDTWGYDAVFHGNVHFELWHAYDYGAASMGMYQSQSQTPLNANDRPRETIITNASLNSGQELGSSRFLLNNPDVLTALQSINLHPNTHYPMVSLSSTPCLKDSRPPQHAQFRHMP